MGGISLRTWLELDPKTEQFTGNNAATEICSRKAQREQFAVPDLERSTLAKAG